MNHTFSDSLKNAAKSCKNFVFKGDVNIDIGILNSYNSKLEQFPSLCNLKSLIKKETCITKGHKSTTNLISTNKPLCFQSSSVIETGLSDHERLKATFSKSRFTRFDLKVTYNRNFENFDENLFFNNLKEENFNFSTNYGGECYKVSTNIFIKIFECHIPLKKRYV